MILVTGGTGFLGSTLLQRLIDDGQSIIATKRESSIIPEQLKSSSLIQWVDADITDYYALEELVSQVNQIYHCAAVISYHKSDASKMFQTNIEGTKHIVNLCLHHEIRLVHVSSIAALGTNKQGHPVKENDKWEFSPNLSKYSLAKYESEMEVWRGIAEGLDAVIVNPSVIMGVGTDKNASKSIFELVKKGNKIYPLGSIGVVDVQDVAKIMMMLMNSEISGQRFILNAENISNRELLEKISSRMNKPAPTIKATPTLLTVAWRVSKALALLQGKKPVLTRETARAATKKLAYDNTKIINTLGVNFKSVDQIVDEVCQAYYA